MRPEQQLCGSFLYLELRRRQKEDGKVGESQVRVTNEITCALALEGGSACFKGKFISGR